MAHWRAVSTFLTSTCTCLHCLSWTTFARIILLMLRLSERLFSNSLTLSESFLSRLPTENVGSVRSFHGRLWQLWQVCGKCECREIGSGVRCKQLWLRGNGFHLVQAGMGD